jgi:hypothetical protein
MRTGPYRFFIWSNEPLGIRWEELDEDLSVEGLLRA